MAKSLTRIEKIELALSLTAILISIASPIITYYWLDPTLQEFKLRARLQIEPTFTGYSFTDKGEDRIEVTVNELNFKIINNGQLPAKDVLVTLQYKTEEDAVTDIQIEPPIPIDATIKGTTKFITLKKAIAPKDVVKINLIKIPASIWISNEYGETNVVKTLSDIEGIWKGQRGGWKEIRPKSQ